MFPPPTQSKTAPKAAPPITQQRVLAFDFGLRHIGVATAQTITGTATPLPELRARNGEPEWPTLLKLVTEWRPDLLLVGLPLNMDDTDNPITARARTFATALRSRLRAPVSEKSLSEIRVLLVDERLSTRAANDALAAGRQHKHHHGMAACVIAETWLNDPGFAWPRVD